MSAANTGEAVEERALAVVAARLPPGGRVLDAGCGRGRPLGVDAYVVGIDSSAEALAQNTVADETVLGDLVTHPFPDESFDAVVCRDVLEHLPDPERALARLARTLKPGATMLLTLPNAAAPKGVATKLTPFWFHVWASKAIFGSTNAGRPGYGPYPTYMRMSFGKLMKVARAHGLRVLHLDFYESNRNRRLRERNAASRALWRLVELVYQAFSLRDPKLTEIAIVLQKPPRNTSASGA